MDAEQKKKIEELYLQMYEMLYEYARSSMDSDGLAEEMVQDTFAIACQKSQALLESPNPKGWLVNTLKFVICNGIRNQNTATRILAEYMALYGREVSVSDDRESLEFLYGDIAKTEEFLLLKERAIDGLSYLEMAVNRNITQVSCRKRVQRAKEYLQHKMKV